MVVEIKGDQMGKRENFAVDKTGQVCPRVRKGFTPSWHITTLLLVEFRRPSLPIGTV